VSDLAKGRRVAAGSLVVLFVLNLALSLFVAGAPVARFGRPVLVAAACVLVWQGRNWGKWLLALLSLGVLLAGPISVGNHLSPTSLGGLLMWLVSVLTAVSLGMLFLSPDVRAFAASRQAPQPQATAGPAPN
jgi:hypothetical protein